jgi:hypothetical protein
MENVQVNTDHDWPTSLAASQVIDQRCISCHSDSGIARLPINLSDERGHSFWQPKIPHPSQITSRHLVFNLSRPDKSMVLLAPLAREAGGYQLCHKTGDSAPIFQKTDDPGYQTLLAMITQGRNHLETMTRFDMPQFKPHPAYLREMKRYGILPIDTPADKKIDPYETDRKYWESLWHTPPAASTATGMPGRK